MTAYFQRVDADLAQIIANLGDSFVYMGVTIPCGSSRTHEGNEPMEGGEWADYAGTKFTRRCYFDNAQPVALPIPVEGDTITVDGVAVLVGKVKSDKVNPLVTIGFNNSPAPR